MKELMTIVLSVADVIILYKIKIVDDEVCMIINIRLSIDIIIQWANIGRCNVNILW